MTRLYLIRHGETEWNKLEKTQGCMDISLSPDGFVQAKKLAKRLQHEGIDSIYSSDLKRASHTAGVLAESLNMEVNLSAPLREMNFGCWEGLDVESIKKDYSGVHSLWTSSPNRAKIPGGEELIEVQQRATGLVRNIFSLHRGEKVAIVSHGVTLKCMIFGLLGIDLENLSKIKLDNCSISTIEYRDGRCILDTLNDTCHLTERV